MCKRFMKIGCFFCCYLIIVLASAGVYCLVFNLDTTSFLISEQLNKHLVRYDLVSNDIDLAEFHTNAKDLMPISVDGFVGVVASKLMRLSDINDSLTVLDRRLVLLLSQEDSINHVAVHKRDSSAEAYRNSALYSYVQRLDSLNQLMSGVDSTELIARGLLIEKANLELEYAIKNKAVTDYIITDLRGFIPEQDLALMDESSSKIIAFRIEKSLLEQERNELVSDYRTEVNHFHLNRRASVSFWDFLYYSFCVSTTVSFGDIAPNNGLTRFLTVLELLSCIVLVSFILNRVAHGNKREGD